MRCRKAMEREGTRGTPESPWRKGMDVELADAWGGESGGRIVRDKYEINRRTAGCMGEETLNPYS